MAEIRELLASYTNKYLVAAFPYGDDRLKRAKPLDVVFSFDTTGSMYKYLELVASHIAQLMATITETIEGVQFGLVAYGDHCDEKQTYLTKVLPLTNDQERFEQFISTIEKTHGGDEPEAVEDALYEVNDLYWRFNSNRVLILIGDAPPHGVIDAKSVCTHRIDYELETHALASKGVRIYTVQCGGQEATTKVFAWMAKQTGGIHVTLENAEDLVDLMIGVCMREAGVLETFAEDLKEHQGLSESKGKILQLLAENPA
jgi:Mg-chelatase subunit ChlD